MNNVAIITAGPGTVPRRRVLSRGGVAMWRDDGVGVIGCGSPKAPTSDFSVRMERAGQRHEGRASTVCPDDLSAGISPSCVSTSARVAGVDGSRPHSVAEDGPGSSASGGTESRSGTTGCPHPSPHLLFALIDARRPCRCHSGTGWSRQPRDDAAVHAPQSGSNRECDQAPRSAGIRSRAGRYRGDRVSGMTKPLC